jgi:hypothetical protein
MKSVSGFDVPAGYKVSVENLSQLQLVRQL